MAIASDDRIRVEKLELRGRDGSTKDRLVVRHPGAVVIVPVLEDGRLVLIRNRRFTVDQTLLELPAGSLEAEAPPIERPPIEQAKRELEEETGYRCGSIEPLGTFFSSPGFSDELMHSFVATDLEAGPQRLDTTEDISVVLMTPAEVDEAVRNGELRNANGLAALMQWKLRAR